MHQPMSPSSLRQSGPRPNSVGSPSGAAASEAVLSAPRERLTNQSKMSCGGKDWGMHSVVWASIQLAVIQPSLWPVPPYGTV